MDHFYQKIYGWSHYLEHVYNHLVPKLPNPCAVVEVGCWQGRSTAHLAVSLINSEKTFTMHAVDHWRGCDEVFYHGQEIQEALDKDDVFNVFKKNLAPVLDQISIIRDRSVAAAAQFEDNSLDMVVLDDDHAYVSVINSIVAWAPKVKPGGFLCGDDCDDHYPGVLQAVRQAFVEDFRMIDANGIYTEDSLSTTPMGAWVWRKPDNWQMPVFTVAPDPWASKFQEFLTPTVIEPEPVLLEMVVETPEIIEEIIPENTSQNIRVHNIM